MRKFGKLVKFFLLILLIVVGLTSAGQDKKYFVITGKIVPEVETTQNGTIEVTKTGSDPMVIEISKNRRFKIELDYFNEYSIVFKLPGCFSKKIMVSTDLPDDVWKNDNNFPPYPMVVQLFKEIEGIDKSFTLKSAGKIVYSKETDNFIKESYFDDLQIADQINTAKAQSGQVKKEAQAISKQEAQDLAAKQKDFDLIINEADVLFKKGDYRQALVKYQDAKKIFPDKAYANDRIAELQDLVKALEYTEKQEIAKKSEDYNTAINDANKLVGDKRYKEAKDKYQEALKYMPDSDYPKRQIEKLTEFMIQVDAENQKESLYAAAIKEGEALLLKKDYLPSRASFVKASEIKPNEPLPVKRIKEIDQLIIDQRNQLYNQAIAAGDKAFKIDQLDDATKQYELALTYKPDDQYAKDQLLEIAKRRKALQEELDKNKNLNDQYNALIADANLNFKNKTYQTAKEKYQGALLLKPAEVYPKDQLAKIDLLLKQLQDAEETNRLYAESIKAAEDAFGENKLKEAVVAYQKANGFKPSEPLPPKRIAEINKLIAQQEEQARLAALDAAKRQAKEKSEQDSYDQAIALADKAFTEKEYPSALVNYSKALSIKQNEQYPKDRIIEINKIMTDLKIQEYDQAIAAADLAFKADQLDEAETQYEIALASRYQDPYATSQLVEVNKRRTVLQNEKDRLKKLEDQYNELIADAGVDFKNKAFEKAKEKYQTALSLKPTEALPQEQLYKIGVMLEEYRIQEENNRKYMESLKAAQEAFKLNKLAEARDAYKKAMNFKPNEAVPPQRIAELDAMIARQEELANKAKLEKEQQLAKEKADKEAYDLAIAAADKALEDKQYKEARGLYSQALNILPIEKYPKIQISKVDELIAQQLEAMRLVKLQAQKDSLLKIRDEAFNQAMATAKELGLAKKYKNAILKYKDAIVINPDERINVQKLITDLETQIRTDEYLNKQYQGKIALGEQYYAKKRLAEALAEFWNASQFKPEEEYPKKKIAEIQTVIAVEKENYEAAIKIGDQEFDKLAWLNSKSAYNQALKVRAGDVYATNRIKEIDQKILDEKNALVSNAEETLAYNEAMSKGEKAFQADILAAAKTQFSVALNLKPAEPLPAKRIRDIDSILDVRNRDKLAQAQRDLDDKYNKAIAAGDNALKTDLLDNAKTQYELALTIKPDDQYAKDQLIEVEKRRNALQEEQNRLKKLNEEYNALIAGANNDFKNKDYQPAKEKYQGALLLKPTETLPKIQLDKIDALLKQLNDTEEINRLYAESVKTAEEAFTQEKLQEAIDAYQKARGYKPLEPIPPRRIAEINKLLAQQEEKAKLAAIEEAKRLAKEKAEQALYDEAIATADKAFAIKAYAPAKVSYNKAISIKAAEQYPKDKIAEIDQLIAEQKINQQYNEALVLADKAFKEKNLSLARTRYLDAQKIKPEEVYPADQIALIDKMLSEQKPVAVIAKEPVAKVDPMLDAVKSTDDASQVAAENIKKYPKINNYEEAISKADKSFEGKDYPVARFFYYKATEYKPNEEYPKSQIDQIRKLIDSQLSANDLAAYNKSITEADSAFNMKNYSIAKFQYSKALEIKSWEKYPKDRIDEILKLTNQLLSERLENEYKDLITNGDQAIIEKDYSAARYYFNRAITIKKLENYPKIRLVDIEKLIIEDKANQNTEEYNILIEIADKAMKDKDYGLARYNYNKALSLKPTEKYPKDQLKLLVKDAIDNQKK